MSVMASTSDYRHFVGHKVFVTLLESKKTLEGNFHSFNKTRSSVTLRQVTSVPSDGRSFEQYEINVKEIVDIRCLAEGQANLNQNAEQSAGDTKSEEVSSSTKRYASFFNETQYDNLKKKVKECIYLKEINKDFHDALLAIKKCSVVAVSGEGSDDGRFGLMGILGMATSKTVFLFDVVNLGEKGFSAGSFSLKRILESKDILKIVHNCRLLSDNLFHKYNVKLTNVFDTQVCYSTILRNQSGSFPLTAISLPRLISLIFNLPEEFCCETPNLNTWRRRPLADEFVSTAAWKVAFLLPLRHALENAFYAPFDSWCNLYTNVVRDCDILEARSSLERNELLPREMIDFNMDHFSL